MEIAVLIDDRRGDCTGKEESSAKDDEEDDNERHQLADSAEQAG